MFILSNKTSAAVATYFAFREAQVFLFDGAVPQSIDDLSFDPYSATECCKNAVAMKEMGSVAESHWGNSIDIDFTPTAHTTDQAAKHKINMLQANRNPLIPGSYVPVKGIRLGRTGNDGNLREQKIVSVQSECYWYQGSNNIVSSTSVAERISGYLTNYQQDLEFEFGEVRSIDGLVNSHYYRNGTFPNTRYMYVEWFDDVNGVWVPWGPEDLTRNANIDARSNHTGYTVSEVGNYALSYTKQYMVEFDQPVVTSKIRIRFGGKDRGLEPLTVQTRNIQFFTKSDVSAELAEDKQITWAMICPFAGGDNIHSMYENQFVIVPVGKSGEDDPLDFPVLLSDTTIGGSTSHAMPSIDHCRLNVGLI